MFELPQTLTIQVVSIPRRVNGGGTVANNGVRATFGFTAEAGKTGSLSYVEHRPDAAVRLKSTTIETVWVVGNTATIIGRATVTGTDGYTFRLTAVDNGEPGRDDLYGLEVLDPDGNIVGDLTYTPVVLTGGNVQIHK